MINTPTPPKFHLFLTTFTIFGRRGQQGRCAARGSLVDARVAVERIWRGEAEAGSQVRQRHILSGVGVRRGLDQQGRGGLIDARNAAK